MPLNKEYEGNDNPSDKLIGCPVALDDDGWSWIFVTKDLLDLSARLCFPSAFFHPHIIIVAFPLALLFV